MRGLFGTSTVLVLVVIWSIGFPAPAAHSLPDSAPALSVSLVATPPSGDVPLLVTFQANASSRNATQFEWSFGDGSYLNGSSTDANPSHWFYVAGSYNVTVRAVEGNLTGLAFRVIQALSGPLNARVALDSPTSVGGLTVHFEASASGGTETYVSFLWDFGDGDMGQGIVVNYSYPRAGSYLGHLRVADSAQESTTVPFWVNLSTTVGPDSPSLAAYLGTPTTILGLGAGMGAIVTLGARTWSLGRARARGVAGTSGRVSIPQGAFGTHPEAAAPPKNENSPEVRPSPEALRISERVLVHLLTQGRVDQDEIARPSITQAGISDALGISQNSLTHVLARLSSGGLVQRETRHVVGKGRRMRTYELTGRGEAIARALWPRISPSRRIGPANPEPPISNASDLPSDRPAPGRPRGLIEPDNGSDR